MNVVPNLSDLLRLIADAPWWASVIGKVTLVLTLAWTLHFLLVRANPRWRVMVWRSAVIGVLAVSLLDIARLVSLAIPVARSTLTESIATRIAPVQSPVSVPEVIARDQPLELTPAAVSPVQLEMSGPAFERSQPSAATVSRFQLPSLRFSLIAVWMFGIALLSIRSVLGGCRLRRIVRNTVPAPDWIDRQCQAICGKLAIRKCDIAMVEMMTSPCLCRSNRRPLLLIPRHIAATAGVDEMQAILTHELSHLRSSDLFWNGAIRGFGGLLWPHPLVWRMSVAHVTACEYAADADSARLLGNTDVYSRTLAKVALGVRSNPAPVGLAMARVSDVRKRLDRVKISFQQLPLSRRRMAAWLALASTIFLLLGTVRFVYADQPEPVVTKAKELAMEVRIVDTESKPIEGAELTAGYNNESISPESLDDGKYRITYPGDARYVRISAKAPHHVPMVATWDKDDLEAGLPETFSFLLPRGTEISGQVEDAEGNPIEGATVSILNASGRDRQERPRSNVYQYPVQTDAAGRWVCDVMPEQISDVWLKLTHPDYISDSMFGQTAGQVSIDQLRAGSLRLVMNQGVTVRGKVIDADGKPVADAAVYQGSDRFGTDYPETKTDAEGEFRFEQCKPDKMVLTVVANNLSPALLEFNVTADAEPITIAMSTGKTLRVRTVDSDGEPLAGVTLSPDTWNGHRSLADVNVPNKSDENGIYVWEHAPAETVKYSIFKEGFVNKAWFPLTASDDEQVVKLFRPLVVEGRLTDAETDQPIQAFTIVQGIAWEQNDQISWERREAQPYTSADGTYKTRFDFERFGHLLRIEATGYEPTESRRIKSDEGTVTLDFKLKPTEPIEGIVLLPSGEPASGADVTMALPQQYSPVADGRISRASDSLMTTTDNDGQFQLPSQKQSFELLALHESGMAMISSDDFTAGQNLRLQPWATISGTVKIGNDPAKKTAVQLQVIDSSNYENAKFIFQGTAVTDDAGRFKLMRVPPGATVAVSRVIPGDNGSTTYTHSVRIQTQPGKNSDIVIGGTGRPVVGRAVVPPTDAKYSWGVNVIMPDMTAFDLQSRVKELTPEQQQTWYEDWLKTDEGTQYQQLANKMYAAIVSEDGSFRVEDVPAGDYTLSLSINAATPDGQCGFGESLGSVQHKFSIAEMEGERSDEPLELGKVTLALRKFIQVGDEAPAIETITLGGEPLRLEDYTGKYVLLDFWATWCGPCIAEIPNLQKTHDQFQDDDRFQIISISIDSDLEIAAKYLAENPLPWPQGIANEDNGGTIQADFGIQSIPATFLIDPDGKVIAKDLRGEDLATQIAEQLGKRP